MKLAIQGAGSVGIGLASALARPGERLRLIGREPRTMRPIAERGIRRSGLFGELEIPPAQLRVETGVAGLERDPPDWLLVCTKAFASVEVAAALAGIADRLRDRTRLVLCQNGWGNETAFAPFWPAERLFHARVITGFHRRGPPGEVEITAHAAPIAFGRLSGLPEDDPDARALEALAARVSEGGIPAETTRDMRGVLWAKMLYNCALNPLGALAGRRYGALTADPTTRRLVEEVVREIFRVLAASAIPVSWPDADAYLQTFHRELIPPTEAHESSMLQDLRAGRRTEIEALCGAVERLAAEHDIATPVVSALAELVRAAERSGEAAPPSST